jgi:hypothetical protein
VRTPAAIIVLKVIPAALMSTGLLVSCGGSVEEPVSASAVESAVSIERDGRDKTPVTLTLEKIGGYDGKVGGAAEITAYDKATKRLFVVNGAHGTVDVLDLSDPTAPVLVDTLSPSDLGAGVNSVDVHDGLVALAIEARPKTSPGFVALYRSGRVKRRRRVAR